MGSGILVLLAAIYFAYLNWQGTGAEKIKKPRKEQTAQWTENKNNIGSKAPQATRPKRSKRLPAKLQEYELN